MISMVDPKTAWAEAGASGIRFGRAVDTEHPLALSLGVDELARPFLAVRLAAKPPEVPPVRGVEISRRRREDGDWLLLLSLAEPAAIDQYAVVCQSLIEESRRGGSPALAFGVFLQSLDRWRLLFRPGAAGRLTDGQLQGLASELWLLRLLAVELDDWVAAVDAWRGPFGSPQDFVLADKRSIEVKSAHRTSLVVKINSENQLDVEFGSLSLCVVVIERVPVEIDGSMRLVELVDSIRVALSSLPKSLQAFGVALDSAGFDPSDLYYEDVAFVFYRTTQYAVTGDFPRITAASLMPGVGGVSYDIGLKDLEGHVLSQVEHR
jgi:hypothetical protein